MVKTAIIFPCDISQPFGSPVVPELIKINPVCSKIFTGFFTKLSISRFPFECSLRKALYEDIFPPTFWTSSNEIILSIYDSFSRF